MRLGIEQIFGTSSANRRQIELGSVFVKLVTTFGRFADDLPTTFADRAKVEVEGEEISKTNLSWPDSDRERSVSSLRVRYQGDKL